MQVSVMDLGGGMIVGETTAGETTVGATTAGGTTAGGMIVGGTIAGAMIAGATAMKINLRELESLGYSHLYGISPIINALSASKRDFSEDEVLATPEDPDIPEKAIPTTRLFIQESTSNSSPSSRSASKSLASSTI
ncbi:hypothetical protein TrRE_jg3274, partial [Triparma retinervis]